MPIGRIVGRSPAFDRRIRSSREIWGFRSPQETAARRIRLQGMWGRHTGNISFFTWSGFGLSLSFKITHIDGIVWGFCVVVSSLTTSLIKRVKQVSQLLKLRNNRIRNQFSVNSAVAKIYNMFIPKLQLSSSCSFL